MVKKTEDRIDVHKIDKERNNIITNEQITRRGEEVKKQDFKEMGSVLAVSMLRGGSST